MAFWWATEAIPLPVTALLPLALFPLLQVYGPYVDGFTPKEAFTIAAKPYAHPNIYSAPTGGVFVATLGRLSTIFKTKTGGAFPPPD